MPAVLPSYDLATELIAARKQSDALFQILEESALYERPIDARHRIIFYLGHLDGFDSILICREGLGLASPDASLDVLFQAGIDPDSNHLPSDKPSDWPTLEQVRAYVARARGHVDAHSTKAPEEIVAMALEHRLMHLETLAYMFHNLRGGEKRTPAEPEPVLTHGAAVQNEWVTIPAGRTILGRDRSEGFGWDNEFEPHEIHVPAFRAQRFSVSNGEYLNFVKEGAPMPHFWIERSGQLFWRGMFDEIPLPLDWPVYVTQQQAAAYASWLGARLPREEEFHRAAYGEGALYPWGDKNPASVPGNFDFRRWDPDPVWASPENDSVFGLRQLTGNGWQWTSTPFAPFAGFRPHPAYPGYSANFFDGEHFVMKGGSSRTAARLLRSSFRNWFRADYPHMYATFRCVQAA